MSVCFPENSLHNIEASLLVARVRVCEVCGFVSCTVNLQINTVVCNATGDGLSPFRSDIYPKMAKRYLNVEVPVGVPEFPTCGVQTLR